MSNNTISNSIHLPRSTPEEQGVSSAGISAFLDAVNNSPIELHSLMLLRHGHVLAEGWWAPYAATKPHMLFSLSKSFTSTAIGFAVSEGRLSVDDPVLSFFEDQHPQTVSPNLAAMRVRHLLSMSTGHRQDTMGLLGAREDGDWVAAFLDAPVEEAPGTLFVYNSGASYMLSAIVQKVTGQTLLSYLQPRLFGPLSIEGPTWDVCPKGINTGGWGLSIKTEDIAKFGQLYLQKGVWQGQPILPAAWIEEATSKHISNGDDVDSDWQQGYGYQFWRCRHQAYRGDGAFGQFCVVLPEQDAVLAMTSGTEDLQAVLNLVWQYILPAMEHDKTHDDTTDHDVLKDQLAALALHPPVIQSSSITADKVSGKRYTLSDNEHGLQAISFSFDGQTAECTLWDTRGAQVIRCAAGEWIAHDLALLSETPQPVATSGTWRDDETYVMTWRFVETPFHYTVVCRFTEDTLDLDTTVNVSFTTKEVMKMTGSLEGR